MRMASTLLMVVGHTATDFPRVEFNPSFPRYCLPLPIVCKLIYPLRATMVSPPRPPADSSQLVSTYFLTSIPNDVGRTDCLQGLHLHRHRPRPAPRTMALECTQLWNPLVHHLDFPRMRYLPC